MWLSASSVIVMRSVGRFVGVGKVASSGWGRLANFRRRLGREEDNRDFGLVAWKELTMEHRR